MPTPKFPKPPQGPRLLTKHPSTDYSRLIVRYPYQKDHHLAFAFQESARRLAATHTGQAIDDTILLPFLSLYRQAFELQLKVTLQVLAKWRRRFVDPADPSLEPAALDEHLRKDLGHNLHKILNEILQHWEALGFDEAFPEEVQKLVQTMHAADKPGTSFRYSGGLPDSQDNIDFPNLVRDLDDNFSMLSAALDYADELYSAAPGPDEY